MRDKAETSSLAAEAYSIVRQRILRGDLLLGQAISRRRLAAELGMSFPPVTEALLLLEFEGLLESRPRAGTRVRIPSREDVSGHYVVREALEVQAALLCAERATPAERKELSRLAARVDGLSLQSDRSMYLAVHQKLHHRIAECARCDALSVALEKTHALASIWYCVMRKPAPDDSPSRHQDLVDGIFSGDTTRCVEAVREHLAVGRQRALDVLEPYFRLKKSRGKSFHRKDKSLHDASLVGTH